MEERRLPRYSLILNYYHTEMKIRNLILVISLLCITVTASSQTVGVHFEALSFQAALDKAAQTGKVVFMDCYTSWCVPCRYMLNNVFNTNEAGEILNDKAISVKFDMEKGEGIALAKKYKIKAYPTFFILSPQGDILYSIVGGGHWPMFKEKLLRALDDNNHLPILEKKYKNNKISNKELLAYWHALTDGETHSAIRDRVRIKLEDNLKGRERFRKEYWPLYKDKTYDSEAFREVLKYASRFQKNVGNDVVEEYLKNTLSSQMLYCRSRRREQDKETLLTMEQQIKVLEISCKDELSDELTFSMACVEKDLDKMITLIEDKFLDASEQTIWAVLSPFSDWGHKIATATQMQRIKALEKKINSCQKNETLKKSISSFFERFYE